MKCKCEFIKGKTGLYNANLYIGHEWINSITESTYEQLKSNLAKQKIYISPNTEKLLRCMGNYLECDGVYYKS